MKKLLSLLLAVGLVLSMTACAGQTDLSDASGETTLSTFTEQTDGDTTQDTTTATDDQPDATETTGTSTETTAPDSDSSSETQATQPSAGTIVSTTPGNDKSESCSHSYKVTATKASTCSVAGTKTYTCSKCQSAYQEALALAEHKYADATCTVPKTCTACGKTSGAALGHSWNKYDYCTRCDVKKAVTGPITFKATVKSDRNVLISGVTVTVYVDGSATAAGSAVTNSSGVATMTLESGSSYKVVLSNIPEGYSGKESYTFSSGTVSINLTTEPVLDPLDHSRAMYKVGSTMADFTLKDIDGNTYTLSQLRQENKLIILDFWYVACTWCRDEFPIFEEALKQYGDDVVFLAVDPYDSAEKIREAREEDGVTFPLVQDTLNLHKGFEVSAYPTTVFIDADGKILSIHKGAYASEAAFLQAIEKYL